MPVPLTDAQAKRVRGALAETHRHLAKELAYSPHLQKADRIAFYRAHIAKLEGMLATKEWPEGSYYVDAARSIPVNGSAAS